MKSFSDLEQSKVLSKILPLESADMTYTPIIDIYSMSNSGFLDIPDCYPFNKFKDSNIKPLPCWSLAILLKCLSEIKPQVYTPVLFPSEGKWILQFVEYSHGNVCEVSCDNPVDACVAMVESLHELNFL